MKQYSYGDKYLASLFGLARRLPIRCSERKTPLEIYDELEWNRSMANGIMIGRRMSVSMKYRNLLISLGRFSIGAEPKGSVSRSQYPEHDHFWPHHPYETHGTSAMSRCMVALLQKHHNRNRHIIRPDVISRQNITRIMIISILPLSYFISLCIDVRL